MSMEKEEEHELSAEVESPLDTATTTTTTTTPKSTNTTGVSSARKSEEGMLFVNLAKPLCRLRYMSVRFRSFVGRHKQGMTHWNYNYGDDNGYGDNYGDDAEIEHSMRQRSII